MRRPLTIVLACLALAAFYAWHKIHRPFTGAILGANYKVGHLLRDKKAFPPPNETIKTGVVIVGGGVSGLSAAWQLNRQGYHSFLLLEMESQLGGNAQSGKNEVSAYPWGAHYVTLPAPTETYVRQLFEELGVIEGYNKQGQPIYNELYLCSAPQERLYLKGRWQEDLVPEVGVDPADQSQYKSFFAAMTKFRQAYGADGKKAFCIPLVKSSQDPRYLKFDRISMADFMTSKGWTSTYLRWYVDYCCRDDYGTHFDQVSAWAGIHYFAARTGRAANAPENSVLTWPEGNGWLVNRLAEKVGSFAKCDSLVYNVEQKGKQVWVDYYDLKADVTKRVICSAVVFAAPRFEASYVLRALRESPPGYLKAFTYAPWMVANLTVTDVPSGEGVPIAWDNVFYKSDSLGYVVANHQDLKRYPDPRAVLTYYYPLCQGEPPQERQKALQRTYDDWANLIVKDLSQVHPDIRSKIRNLDVWLWGHGMIRPLVGFIWGRERREALKPLGPIFFAHSDMSGISIFEEAQYRGVTAANAVMAYLHLQTKRLFTTKITK